MSPHPLFQLLPKSRVCSWDVRNVQRYVRSSLLLYLLIKKIRTDVKPLYPFLIAYGASGAATVVLCIGVILALPSASLSSSDLAVSASQRAALVAFYIPFLFVPALIALDLGIRTSNTLQVHARPDTDEDRKSR